MKIDNKEYTSLGKFQGIQGGNSDSSITFTHLRDPDGRECWLLEDHGFFLYQELDSQRAVQFEHERYEVARLEAFAWGGDGATLRWVRFHDAPPGLATPFQGSSDGMVVSHEMRRKDFIAVELTVHDGVYYSQNFPAREIPRQRVSLEPPRLSIAQSALLINGALAFLFALSAWTGYTQPVIALWWLALPAVIGRCAFQGPDLMGQTFRILSGVALLHVATHGIDGLVTGGREEPEATAFEAGRLALTFLGVAVLSQLSPRWYGVVLDGAMVGGGCAFAVLLCLMMAADVIRDWDYTHFLRWNVGQLPWSLLGPIGLFFGWRSLSRDYAKVPLTYQGVLGLLGQTLESLKEGPAAAIERSGRLKTWVDDARDALNLSSDPRVQALAPLGPSLRHWIYQMETLGRVSWSQLEPERQHRLADDLTVLTQDLQELITAIQEPDLKGLQVFALRFSPMLSSWRDP